MRIDLHINHGEQLASVEVDLNALPPVLHVDRADGGREEHYLDWDGAIDDEDQLRKCPACGCSDMYKRSVLPPVTGLVIVMAVAVICSLLYGFTTDPLAPMAVIVGLAAILNAVVAFKSPRKLVCYNCGSVYRGVGISHERGEWDAQHAELYRSSNDR